MRLTWVIDICFEKYKIKKKYRFGSVERSIVKYQLCQPAQITEI